MSVRYGARAAAVGFLGPLSEGYYHNVAESHDEAILLKYMDTQ